MSTTRPPYRSGLREQRVELVRSGLSPEEPALTWSESGDGRPDGNRMGHHLLGRREIVGSDLVVTRNRF